MGKKKRQSSDTPDVNNEEKTILNTTDSDVKEKSSCKVKSEKRIHKSQNKVGKSKCNLDVKKTKRITFDDADNPQEVDLITTHNKSKKTVFIDDVPQDVAVASNSGQTNVSSKASRQKTQQNEQEDEETIKDEDIDKFCDEISPDDNVLFENWVKLIEAKLHSKK